MAEQSVVTKTPDVRYTAQDYQTIRQAVIDNWKARYPGINFDFSSPNYVTAMIELQAYLAEQLHYALEVNSREAFMVTARLAESILKHARGIGFEAAGRVAATAEITLTLDSASAFDVLIPEGSTFFTADAEASIAFRVLEDATIPAGPAGTSISITVENSQTFTATFTANGSPLQEFVTQQRPVLRSGVDGDGEPVSPVTSVRVDGVSYTIVDNFEASEPTSRHVILTLLNGGRLQVRFGDGRKGVAPSGSVEITGRVGGGARGNNATVTRGPTFSNTNGDTVSVSVSQTLVSSGGADEASLEDIKIQAPLSLQVNQRTVSRTDFKINSEAVSGIDRALPLTNEDDNSIPLNTTEVLVLSDSPTNAQVVGGNAAATTTTAGVDDDLNISINGETPQLISIGTQASGEDIAAQIQSLVRGLTPEFPLDNDEAYSGFTCEFDAPNEKYTLTTGQAGLSATLDITTGPNDAAVALKLDDPNLASKVIGASPSAGTISAVETALTVTNPTLITHQVLVTGPSVNIINFDFEIRFSKSANTAALQASVRDEIRKALTDFFAPRLSSGQSNVEVDFGKTMRFSDWISVVNGVDGVESVDEDSFLPADDVTIDQRDFPVLGGIIVRNDSTGDPI